MYILLFLLLVALGIRFLFQGLQYRRKQRLYSGVSLLIGTPLFFGLMSLWGEWLWFENLGYSSRFWTLITEQVASVVLGAVIAGMFGFLLSIKTGIHLRRLVTLAAIFGGVIWGVANTETLLLYIYSDNANVTEPILNLDTSFYLFHLPFYDGLLSLLMYVAVIAVAAALTVWESGGVIRPRRFDEVQGSIAVLPMANAGLAWVIMLQMIMGICHLLYSDWGVVQGPGWVDINVRIPALWTAAFGFFLVGLLPLFASFRNLMTTRLGRWIYIGRPAIAAMSVVWSGIIVVSITALLFAPAMVQWLIVKPNEITFEKPYIANNIEFTRRGFGLHNVEESAFSPAAELTQESMDNNRNLLSEVRLWDWRALDAVYRQFQEIRLYYEFVDVDIDRYIIGDRYRQLMVSARELGQHNLSPQSQTFVNKRFKYTHGYGYTAAAVSDFTNEGLPNLLVQDIPPVAHVPELAVERPEIYYGELTIEAAVVNTKEEEFDYPSGEKNIYTRYKGTGGVQLSNFWRKFIFSWKLDGTVLLLSNYPTTDSRVMIHRQISQRVETIAPFITFDEDPYLVASEGRLFWIIDGYTKSDYYPYSQSFDSLAEGTRNVLGLNRANYVRNSVKAVVDAYTGSVDLYVFDDEDEIIAAWTKAFPTLFKDKSNMPAGLRSHVRYPYDYLLVQGLIYAQYHMSDPEVFYNQEDLWVRATEKHYKSIIAVEPYYVMWELPGSDKAEFVLILPFTPKNKQVLIGWIAGLSDGDNYGRFLAYNFPKETRMLGPQQVETKIDQDAFLSGQLTLWSQQGSDVIRGNVLAIPLDNTLIYVEPIYLRAETAAYPELRLVAVMHGDKLSYAPNLEEALQGLFDGELEKFETNASPELLARQAKWAFENYLKAQGNGEFEQAATQLGHLRDLLNQLVSVKASNTQN